MRAEVRSSKVDARERCESGRIGLTANELTGLYPVRGFKSLPLRWLAGRLVHLVVFCALGALCALGVAIGLGITVSCGSAGPKIL